LLSEESGEDLAIIFSVRPAVAAAASRSTGASGAGTGFRAAFTLQTHRPSSSTPAARTLARAMKLGDARRHGALCGGVFHCDETRVLVASTGVIGVRLDMSKNRIRPSRGDG